MSPILRTFRYEEGAIEGIRNAKKIWSNIEDMINSLEWGLLHDPDVGRLLNETGLRGFDFPGARSINEPDIEVFYRVQDNEIVILSLEFREAKSHYTGTA